MADASSVYATPDPATLYGSGLAMRFTTIERLNDGTVLLTLTGTTASPVSIQTADAVGSRNWTTLTILPALNSKVQFVDLTATNRVQRFYRAITP